MCVGFCPHSDMWQIWKINKQRDEFVWSRTARWVHYKKAPHTVLCSRYFKDMGSLVTVTYCTVQWIVQRYGLTDDCYNLCCTVTYSKDTGSLRHGFIDDCYILYCTVAYYKDPGSLMTVKCVWCAALFVLCKQSLQKCFPSSLDHTKVSAPWSHCVSIGEERGCSWRLPPTAGGRVSLCSLSLCLCLCLLCLEVSFRQKYVLLWNSLRTAPYLSMAPL